MSFPPRDTRLRPGLAFGAAAAGSALIFSLLIVGDGPAVAAEAGRLAIVAPPEATDFVRAAGIALEAEGFVVVPAAEVDTAVPDRGDRPFGPTACQELARALKLAAVVTIAVTRADASEVVADFVMRNRRGKVIRTWRWARSPAPTPEPQELPPDVMTPPPPSPESAVAPALAGPAPAPSAPPVKQVPAHPAVGPARDAPAGETTTTLHRRSLARPPILDVGAGGRLIFRRLTFASDPDGLLAGFKTALPTLGLGFDFRFHPFRGALRSLGWALGGEIGQPFRSITPAGLYLANNSDLGGVMSWRFSGEAFAAVVGFGVGLHRFSYRLEGARDTHPQPLPDVSYVYLQPGLELAFSTGRNITVRASLHHRRVLDAGGLTAASWFPGATVTGFDGGVSVEHAVGRRLTVAAGYDLRRYNLDLSQAQSVRQSAGAVDLYHGLSARLHVALGRTEPGP